MPEMYSLYLDASIEPRRMSAAFIYRIPRNICRPRQLSDVPIIFQRVAAARLKDWALAAARTSASVNVIMALLTQHRGLKTQYTQHAYT